MEEAPAEEQERTRQIWDRELPLLIFRLLSNRDRAALACTCRRVREALSHPSLCTYLVVETRDTFDALLRSASRLAAHAGGLVDIELQARCVQTEKTGALARWRSRAPSSSKAHVRLSRTLTRASRRQLAPSAWFNTSSATAGPHRSLRGVPALRRLVLPPSHTNLSLAQAEELHTLCPRLERGSAQLILPCWPLLVPRGDEAELLAAAAEVQARAEKVWRTEWDFEQGGAPPEACLRAWAEAEEAAQRLPSPLPLPLRGVLDLSLAVSRAEATEHRAEKEDNPWLATSPLRRLLDANPQAPLLAISLHRKGLTSQSAGCEVDVLVMLHYLLATPARAAQLRSLDLRDVRLSGAGAFMLSVLLNMHLHVLEELWLNDLRGLPGQLGRVYRAAAASASMKRLDLSYCPLGEAGGRALAEGLRARSAAGAAPVSLTLNQTESRDGLGDDGLIALLPGLGAVSELHLRRNGVSCRGAEALGRALAGGLEVLDLEANNIRDRGAVGVARGLGQLLGLRQVVMSGNIVGQEGAEALVAEAGRLGERQAAAGAAQRCVMVLGEAAVSAEKRAEAWARWEAQAAAMRDMQMGGGGGGAAAAGPAGAAAAEHMN